MAGQMRLRPTPTASASPDAVRPRNLGSDPHHSSSFTPTTSYSDLFPSASSTDASNQSSGGTNVYYLVFLGVLIVLLLLAACLAYRAYRIRRRYRTAAQLAIARGQAPPPMTEQYWGLGRLSGWTPTGLDRLGVGTVWADPTIRSTAGGRWVRVPELWEAQVADGIGYGDGYGDGDGDGDGALEDKKYQREDGGHGLAVRDVEGDAADGDVWQNAQVSLGAAAPRSPRRGADSQLAGGVTPLMVQSLLAIDDPTAPATPDEFAVSPHQMGPRPHPPASFSLAILAARRRRAHAVPDEPAAPQPVKEQDRVPVPGEPVRVAVVIQMPVEMGAGAGAGTDDGRRRRQPTGTGTPGTSGALNGIHGVGVGVAADGQDEDEDEDEAGWNDGMELAVWEGVVRPDSSRSTP